MLKVLILFLLSFQLCFATYLSFKAQNKVALEQEGKIKKYCPVSGLKLSKYYKISNSASLINGVKREYASFYFMLKDKKDYGFEKSSIKVIDYFTEEKVLATKAYFLINSKIRGIAYKSAIIAFKNKASALKLSKKYGGEVVNFDKAFLIASKNYERAQRRLNLIKKKRSYLKGEKIFKKLCKKDFDPKEYLEINELKIEILEANICKKMSESHLQDLALYLWDVKRFPKKFSKKIIVHEKARCPVCAMFVAKYPRWAAQIKTKKEKLYFDGVKDLMKFYFNPKKWAYDYETSDIKEILVTDYYSQEAINGFEAFYVIGSDTYGPMGHELIPFESFEDAKTFKNDHGASKILKFNEIDEKGVYKLDVLQN